MVLNDIQKEILDIISNVWEVNPYLRYGQVLTGLKIIEFANKESPVDANYNVRDIFYDLDESVLKRIKTSSLYLDYIKK